MTANFSKSQDPISQCSIRHNDIIDGGLFGGAHHTFWRTLNPPACNQLPDELLALTCSHFVALPRPRYFGRHSNWRLPVDLASLIKCSDYFSALVRHVTERVLHLPWNQLSFLEHGFQAFISFANGSQLTVTDENAIDLYMTADFLICSSMRAQALQHLAKRCTTDLNFALYLLLQINCYWLPELNQVALDAVLAGFPIIAGTTKWPERWLELPADLVHGILSHNALNCQSEEQVLIAASRWLYANPGSGRATIRLAECVRFGLLEPSQRGRLSIEYPTLLRWAPPPWSLIMVNNSASDRKQCRSSATDLLTVNARPREPHEVVLVFGGWGQSPTAVTTRAASTQTDEIANVNQQQQQATGSSSTTASGPTGPQAACQMYNPRMDSWLLRCPSVGNYGQPSGPALLPGHIGQLGARVYSGCVLVDNVIHVIGGYDGHRALRTVWRYNLRNPGSGWHIGSCMTRKRYYVCCAATEAGVIYAIGGHTGEVTAPAQDQLQRGPSAGRLSSVERLRPGENVWIEVTSLQVIRSDAGAAAIGESVVVAGGFDGVRYHDTAEMYDPGVDQWTFIGRMCHPRSGVALVAIDDAVFAVGGNDGEKRLRSIEKYQFGGPTDEWEEVGQMLQAKSNLSAVALDGGTRILSVGGWSDAGQPGVLATSEMFCLSSGASKSASNAGFAASATAACVIQGRLLVQELLQQI